MNKTLTITAAKPHSLIVTGKRSPSVPGIKPLTEVSQVDEPSKFYTIEEIHVRAETITPHLKKILDYKPSPHWGLNE